jgi:hypothetical protein
MFDGLIYFSLITMKLQWAFVFVNDLIGKLKIFLLISRNIIIFNVFRKVHYCETCKRHEDFIRSLQN